jgi:hypothetical protein
LFFIFHLTAFQPRPESSKNDRDVMDFVSPDHTYAIFTPGNPVSVVPDPEDSDQESAGFGDHDDGNDADEEDEVVCLDSLIIISFRYVILVPNFFLFK